MQIHRQPEFFIGQAQTLTLATIDDHLVVIVQHNLGRPLDFRIQTDGTAHKGIWNFLYYFSGYKTGHLSYIGATETAVNANGFANFYVD